MRKFLPALLLVGFVSPITTPVANATTCIASGDGYTVTTSGASCIITVTATGSTTITLPSGIAALSGYVIVGAGGGGGASRGGGGGSGGVVSRIASQALTSNSITVVVGAGGGGGTSSTAGTNGGNSSLTFTNSTSTTVTAGGGGGGGTHINSYLDSVEDGVNGNTVTVGAGGAGGGASMTYGTPTSSHTSGASGGNSSCPTGATCLNGQAGGTQNSTATDRNTSGGGGVSGPGIQGSSGTRPNGGNGYFEQISSTRVAGGGGGAGGLGQTDSGCEVGYTSAGAGSGGLNGAVVIGGNGQECAATPPSTPATPTFKGSGGGGAITGSGGSGSDGVVIISYDSPDIAFTSHPTDRSVVAGNGTSFSVGVMGTGTKSYQWQTSTDGSTWSNVGSNSSSYSLISTTMSDNGKKFRVIVTNTLNGLSISSTSNVGTLTVTPPALSQPTVTGYTPKSGAQTTAITVNFVTNANAASYTARVYQSDGVTLVGAPYTNISSGGTLGGLSPSTTYRFSIQAIGDGVNYGNSVEALYATTFTTAAIAVSPTFSTHPSDASKGVGLTVQLRARATASDSGTITYLWQKSTDSGSSWTDLTAGTTCFSTDNCYTTSALILADNGVKYRVIATNTKNSTTATATSNVATITVPSPPAISGSSEITQSFDSNVYSSGATATVTYTLKCLAAQANGPSFYDMVGYEGGPSWSYNDYLGSGTSNDGGYTWTISKNYTLSTNGTWWSNPYLRGACLDSYNFTYPGKIFAFVGIPGVTSLSATAGSPNGGDSITISGYALDTVTGVTFGGTSGTITAQSPTSLTVTTPAKTAGSHNVSVTNSIGSQTKYSDSSRTSITFNTQVAPSISSLSITGTTNVASSLTAAATISGTSVTTTYQWQKSTTSGGTFSNISGATSSTYTIPYSLSGQYIRVVVTSTNLIGSATQTSSETARIGNAVYVDLVPSVYSGSGTTWSSVPSTTSPGFTLRNSPTFTAANGAAAAYFSLTGSSSQWMSDNNGLNNPTVFSYAIWFRATPGSSGKLIGFENNQSSTATTYDRQLYIGTDGLLYWGIYTGTVQTRVSTYAVNDGNWHYAVATYSSGTSYLYLNGVVQGSALTATAQTHQNPSYYKIGGTKVTTWTNAGDDYFTGDIGRVTIFSTAISSSNVTTYFNADSSGFANPAPTLSGASISGTTTQGQILTASVVGAGGGTATSTTYQWSSSATSGGSYTNISGATSSTYTLTSSDANKYVKVTITVSNSGGSASATSSATSAITPLPPTISSATISGTVGTGKTLTGSASGLGGGPVATTTYQWKISDTSGGTFSDIAGATNSTYVIANGDATKYLKVLVTVQNSAGSNSALSAETVAVVGPPTITSLSVSSGPTSGSTSVVISGTNLASPTSVTFGGTSATVNSSTSTSVTVTTPAKSAGAVDVIVNGQGGTVTSSGAFTYVAAPTITSLDVTSGTTSGGTTVTITGTNLTGTSGITFGGTSGTSVTVVSATSVTVVTPAKAAGVVNVVITTPGGSATRTNGYTYVTPPTIANATISGTTTVGQVLTATAGSNTGGAISSTTYQWQSASTAGGSYSNIAGATSSTYTLASGEEAQYVKVIITVSNAGGSASATSSATAQIAAAPAGTPTITSLNTTSGATSGGTVVTITGTNLANVSGITFGGTSGTNITSNTSTSVTVTTPAKSAGTVDVVLTNPGGTVTRTSAYTYVAAPTIASATISGTTTVGQTLTGTAGSNSGGAVSSTSYQWQSAATVNGTYSNIAGATNRTYVLTSNETGKFIKVVITVSNVGGNASATSGASTVVASNTPSPTISSITRNAGTTAGGTSVTIAGTNLSNVTNVTFGGTAATITSKTSTQVVVLTPAKSAGAVDVIVTNPSGSATSSNGFTYLVPPATRSWTAVPNVNSTSVGSTLTVTFTAVCTTPQTYGPSMYDLIYANSGSWIYNSYMGSGTSTDGGYTWVITKNYAVTSSGVWKVVGYERGACWDSYNFTYSSTSYVNVDTNGPTITSLSTTSGPVAGGTSTTVTGTNLTGVTGITLGGVAATIWNSNTSTSVTFITPTSATAGAKNLVITAPAGSVTSNNAFTYVAPVTITYNVNTADSGTPSRTSDSYTPNSGGYSLPVVGTMVKTGNSFSGWASAANSNTAITSPYNPQSSLTVYAIWTPNTYTTTYNSNGATSGTAPSSSTNNYGAAVTVPDNTGSLARTGYTLAGWNTAANGSGTSYVLSSGTFVQGVGNRTLYAEWVPITYTISYNVNGSSDSVPTSHTNQVTNSLVTLANAVTKAGSAFVGWTNAGVTYAAGASFKVGTSDETMVAKWVAVYTLTYNLNGVGASGSVPADFTYTSGDPVTVTNVVPTRTGYDFGGWSDQSGTTRASSSSYNIGANNYILSAIWTPILRTITYALNGGSGSAPTESSKGISSTFTVAAAPTRTGYTFTGWSDGSNTFGAGSTYTVATSNITLTAQWSAISYDVIYDLAQGKSAVPDPLTKNYLASWSLPSAPTRVGYTFKDWYDGTLGYNAGATYTLNTASSLTIIARWTEIVYYQVTYDLAGGLGDAPRQDPLQNGQSFSLAAAPTKTDYSFAGWDYNGQTYSAGTSLIMPAQNVTVTALWTAAAAGTYAITYITNGSQTAGPSVPSLAQNSTFTVDDGSGLVKQGYNFAGWTYSGTTYNGGETFTMPASAVTFSAVWVPTSRATSVTHSVDSTSITRGRTITVTYNVGCFTSSATIPTFTERVTSTGESFINDITANLTIVDAGYNWTVTRVYTLSTVGTYTVQGSAIGGCFGSATDSTASNVTVTDTTSSNNSASPAPREPATTTTTSSAKNVVSVAPITVVGAQVARIANSAYSPPKLDPATILSVAARAGATATTNNKTTNSGPTTMLSVASSSPGLSEVKIAENQLAVTPAQGFSGRATVTVNVTNGETTTTVQVPVTVLPEPVKTPVVAPKSSTTSVVTWEPSPNANTYQVLINGNLACESSSTSCTVRKLVGPNTDVAVVANGGDQTSSEHVEADYTATNAVSVARLSGTFNRSTLNASDIRNLDKAIKLINTQGFENVEITDVIKSKNSASASNARLQEMIKYIKENVQDPDVTVKVVQPTTRSFTNQILVK